MKIAIFGLGGVGGYFAAQATNFFCKRDDVEFYYIARGEHLNTIKEQGLTLQRDGDNSIVAHPKLATDKAEECGVVDYLIYATKSYSIDENIEAIGAITDKNSVIVTFMNGVDGAQKLREALDGVTVIEGCVFIYSQISAPGVVLESGGLANFQIGDDNSTAGKACELFEMMEQAIDKISYYDDMSSRIWGKFSYISPYATITTQYNITSDEITGDDNYRAIYKSLCEEFGAVVKAMGIDLGYDIYEHNFELVKKLPQATTSSMQRDYYSGRRCEVESLTVYISHKGTELGIPTPHYDRAATSIIKHDR